MFTIDLSGLYPSVMRMLGCSPETKIMKLVGGYDDYVSVMARYDVMIDVYIFADDETISINAADLEDVIRSNGYTISPFGIVFTGEHGILSRFVEHFVDKRAYYRGLIKEAAKAGDNEAAERYDLYQLVYKIAANSTYGVSGQISFKLYDLDISASITSTAQIISKFQAQLANQLTKSTFGG
jgi:DNA polymerase elongation subunit (family B)